LKRLLKLRLTAAALCIATTGLVACFFGDPGPRGAIGVKLSDGQIVIRVKACESSSLVTGVALATARDVNDDLWRITAPEGSSTDRFVLGETPSGFVESIALGKQVQPGTRYLVSASLLHRTLQPGGEFDPGRLSADIWLVNPRKSMTDAEFDRFKPCG
jgi:hypothetical protein